MQHLSFYVENHKTFPNPNKPQYVLSYKNLFFSKNKENDIIKFCIEIKQQQS